jgi:hypothetical protein
MAYRSFGGEVEASSTPTICHPSDYCRHQLSAIAHLRAVLLLLGHTKGESTVRYLGIEVDDALSIAEQVEF